MNVVHELAVPVGELGFGHDGVGCEGSTLLSSSGLLYRTVVTVGSLRY